MKIVKRILNVFFILVLLVSVGMSAVSLITSRSNHGVPNYFGYQIMVVKSDSMAPTLPVGSAVVAKKVDLSTLVPQQKDEAGNIIVEGDIVSYVSARYGVVVTHRLINIVQNGDSYTLTTIGENEHSDQCGQEICVFTPEEVAGSNFMGKVTSVSKPLGAFFSFINQMYVRILLIVLPLVYLIGSMLYDYFTKDDDDEDEEDKEKVKGDKK